MSALALVTQGEAAASLSLYDLAEELQCLIDTRDMVDAGTAEQSELDALIAPFEEALPRKVDSVCRALSYLEAQAEQAKAEAGKEYDRLMRRSKHFASQAAALESYCIRVLERLPDPPKRKPRQLQGEFNTLTLATAERCVVTDPAAIPAEFKTTTLKMPADLAQSILETLFPETLEHISVDTAVRIADVKKAIKGGREFEGADIEYPKGVRRS